MQAVLRCPVPTPPGTSERLNRDCPCTTLDPVLLDQALERELASAGLPDSARRQLTAAMFARQPVFVAQDRLQAMAAVVAAVTEVTSLPGWREVVLATAPASAATDDGSHGVFFGYDFHLHGSELGLIEINTNAGGALLNAALARAQEVCCPEVESYAHGPHTAARWEAEIVAMFRQEWQRYLARRGLPERPLTSVAIVDHEPMAQHLYPEFLLFQSLLRRHGITTVIADPASLRYLDGALWADGQRIDLVYNRSTDFYFAEAASQTLAQAWREGAVVVTPNPYHYALYADKRNLARLTDPDWLRGIGATPATIGILARAIPKTIEMTLENADRLWSERRQWFFKPVSGYGARAAYRGDKLTRRVWAEILAATARAPAYVAQRIVHPGERLSVTAPEAGRINFDLRHYVYGGEIQWTAARLYQGQTTNFRTPGGGFAPVYAIAETAATTEVTVLPAPAESGSCCPGSQAA